MRLLTAHLENFRSAADFDIDFRGEGCHAVIGAPGAGKSTIFAAMLFSLFGDPGPDQDLLDLRYDQASDGSDVVADCTWTEGGATYRTERMLRRGRRKGQPVEKASARMWKDGVEIDSMTPTLMTAEVTKILGMGSRGLTGSILIRQGEVDKLTTAPPTEVQRLVEQHTGISELTKARDNARKSANKVREVADALPGSLPEVVEADEAATEAETDAEALETGAGVDRSNADRAHENWRNAHAMATGMQQRSTAAQAARERVIAARARLDSALLAEQGAVSVATETGIAEAANADQVEAAWQDWSAQRAVIADLGNTLLAANKVFCEQSAAGAQAQTAAEAAVAERSQHVDTMDQLNAAIDDTTRLGQAARTDEATAAAEVSRLAKALAALTDLAAETAHCPTCQNVLDDPSGLIDTLTTQLGDAESRQSAAGQRIAELTETVTEQKGALRAAEQRLARIDTVIDAAKTAAGRVEAAAATLQSAIDDTTPHLPAPAGDYSSAVSSLREVKAAVDKKLARIGEQRAAVRQLEQARQAVGFCREELMTAETAVIDAPDPDEIAAALADAGRLQSIAESLRVTANASSTAASTAMMGASHLRTTAEVAKNQWDRKQSAVTDAEIADTTAQLLAAYRQDLIGDFCEAISASATDLLARFGGEHVGFRLDADFVPRVELADGRLRKTSALSGGEKARVGLAFRLGISMQVTDGGLPDQLFGDEITSYLDEDGRRQILDVINELFTAPILVSHTSEILDRATHVHQLWRPVLGTTEAVAAAEDIAS